MSHFSECVSRLRRERNLTQNEVSKALALSRQTVSNWEKGTIEPNISVLAKIAAYYGVSADFLLGNKSYTTQYECKYRQEGFYWGRKINRLAHEVLRLMPPDRPLRLLDVGCGEGQAAVFFARNGYHVTAFDVAESGLEKGRRLAQAAGVHADFFHADLLHHEFINTYDIIYSTDVLEYVPPQKRESVIRGFREHTTINGLNVLDTFVGKSFIETAPDWEHGKEHFWQSGELFSHYREDWKFELCEESIFDCDSGGIPHRHCMDMMIARKMV